MPVTVVYKISATKKTHQKATTQQGIIDVVTFAGVYQIHRDRLEKWNAENGGTRDAEEINDNFGGEELVLRL